MAFPSTPILDPFTRANASPLDGNWSTATAWWGDGLDLASNAVTSAFGGSTWQTQYGPNVEAYVSLTDFDTIGHYVEIDLSAQSPVSDSSLDGYSVYAIRASDSATTYYLGLARWDAGVETMLDEVDAEAFDGVGIVRVGSTVQVHVRRGGTWELALQATDVAHAVSWITLGIAEDAVVDDFGGGVPVLGRPWYYYAQQQ